MITTPTTLPAPVQQTFDDVLLSVRTPNLIMKLGALAKRLPAKGGRTLRMARYDRLPTAPVPLGPSGATPPATPLNRVDIDATMSFYGLYVAINQQVTLGLRGIKTEDNYWESLRTFVYGNPRQVSSLCI
jgi:N4-gp56 family major capsid protein